MFALAGNGQALTQQITVAADRSVGWAPWQLAGVLDLAGWDTEALAAGRVLLDLLPPIQELAGLAFDALVDVLAEAAGLAFDVATSLLTAIPVIGQVVEILLAVVLAVVKIVQLAKASEAAKQSAHTVRPAAPSVSADLELAGQIRGKCEGPDWTGIFMAHADPVSPTSDWVRGWSCLKIAKDSGLYSNGRLIRVGSHRAWTFSENDIRGVGSFGEGLAGPLAIGAVPGRMAIHRDLQIGYRGTFPVDTGSWMRLAASAAASVWSLAWGTGPAAFAIDTNLALVSWNRYVGKFLTQLDSGEMCPGNAIRSASRAIIRKTFIVDVLGLPNSAATWPVERVLEEMPLRGALEGLRRRQLSLAGTSAIAYVNARTAPEALRDEIEQRQYDLLTSPLACRIDVNLIGDPLFRGALELEVMNRGLQCYTADQLQAPLLGPDPFDPDVPPPEAPPESAVPQVPALPLPARTGSGSGSKSGSGSGLAMVAGAGLLGGLYLASRRRR